MTAAPAGYIRPTSADKARFAFALALGFAWLGAVAWLGWTSANPVQVSAPQLLSADAVVRCRSASDGQGLEVLAVRWSRRPLPPPMLPKTVSRAGATLPPNLPAGAELWAPAVLRPGGWEVAPIPEEVPDLLAEGLPRQPVYPHTPAVVRQLDALLGPERQP